MTLQEKTIQRYRQLFPNETLRETSSRSNIQITRVFRLFNGKTMKVGELETFERLINEKINENPNIAHFSSVVEDAGAVLSSNELAKITEYISRKLSVRHFSKSSHHTNYSQASIA